MKITYAILLGSLLVGACSNQSKSTQNGTETTIEAAAPGYTTKVVEVVDANTFKNTLASKPGTLLDVRTPGEYKKGFIEGARLLDIFSDEFEAELNKLDRNATYYVYCASGGRSAECAEKMQGMGFKKVYDLDGGMGAWRNAGLPVAMPK